MLPLSSDFYDQLDPIYRQEVLKLENQIISLKENKTKETKKKIYELLDLFSSKLMLPEQFWSEIFDAIWYDYDHYDERGPTAAACIYHLCTPYFRVQDELDFPYAYKKLYTFREERLSFRQSREVHIENLYLPHENLEKNWKEYEKKASSIIPRTLYRRYEKMKALYSKIKLCEENVETWIEAMSEAEDVEFVEQNVEFRLAQDLTNKQLWKSYIKYLSKNDQKKLLETLSKYCRYFISDDEMLKEYQKAAEQYGPSIVPWKNTFDFEIYDRSILKFHTSEIPTTFVSPRDTSGCICWNYHDRMRNASLYGLEQNFSSCLNIHNDSKKNASRWTALDQQHFTRCFCHFSDNPTPLPQKFPFRSNLMNYIVKNAEATILFDLFKTCKWFYSNFPFPVCYSFGKYSGIRQQSLNSDSSDHISFCPLKIDNKIFISTVLEIWDESVNALSAFIPKIYRCTAKYVSINDQHLSMEEAKFLFGSGHVIDLDISIKDQDGNPFIFEDILKLVPQIEKLNVGYTKCSSKNIAQFLCEFPFQKKLEKFYFGDIKVLPEPHDFAEFILKNSKKDYYSSFSFYGYADESDDFDTKYAEIENYREIVHNHVDKQWKESPHPELRCFFGNKEY